MDDIILFLIGALIILGLVVLVITIILKRREQNEIQQVLPRPRGEPIARGADAPAPRRAGRNVRARMRVAAASRLEEDDEDDLLADQIALPEGKIGVKKRKKLELKAEKKIQRERELEEREEKKQRQKELEERRQEEEEKEKEEKTKQEEEEKALKEERERKELEEYLKLKECFAVEEEGFDEEENSEETHKFNEFINYIKEQKVVLLEDLATRFRLKTQDTIERVQELLSQEWLNGVIDDRGKFISITKEEMEAVALFVKQRGRVSIAELVECSNSLINLIPLTTETLSAKS